MKHGKLILILASVILSGPAMAVDPARCTDVVQIRYRNIEPRFHAPYPGIPGRILRQIRPTLEFLEKTESYTTPRILVRARFRDTCWYEANYGPIYSGAKFGTLRSPPPPRDMIQTSFLPRSSGIVLVATSVVRAYSRAHLTLDPVLPHRLQTVYQDVVNGQTVQVYLDVGRALSATEE